MDRQQPLAGHVPRRPGKTLFFVALMAALAFLGPVSPRRAEAGQPLIDLAKGTIDMIVYFEYEATLQDIEGWKPMFDEYAKGLYDATEGQLRLRKVVFTTNKSLSAKASVWISNDTRANAGAYAFVDGVGNLGQHIQLHQIHKCTGVTEDQVDSNDPDIARRARAVVGHKPKCLAFWRGQFGILHETGHYLFGLRDEYLGCSVRAGLQCPDNQKDVQGPGFFCSVGQKETACIMDGGTTVVVPIYDETGKTVVGVLQKNLRTEFCRSFLRSDVTGSYGHTPGYPNNGSYFLNKQQRDLNMDCWRRIGSSEVRLTLPSGFPQKQDLLLDQKPLPIYEIVNDDPGFVLAVDTSRSMNRVSVGDTSSKFQLAKEGAVNAVDLIRPGEKVAVVRFDERVVVAQEMTTVPDQAARDDLADLINNLPLGGTGTTTGGALDTARGLLEDPDNDAMSGKAIVLLSDGRNTQGMDPVSVAGEIAREGRLAIHTVGIGDDADTQSLEKIASMTGGSFHFVENAGQLPAVLPGVFAAARGDVKPESTGDTIPYLGPGDLPRAFDVQIDDFTRLTTFIIGHGVNAPIAAAIVSPSGLRYAFDPAEDDVCTVDTLDSDPPSTRTCGGADVSYIRNPRQQIYTAPTPEAGIWTIEIRNTVNDGISQPVSILVISDAPELAATGDISNARPVCYPEPIRVKTTVVAQVPVTGVSVTAQVHQPGGFTETISLFDDGLAVHGDDLPGDGVYGALYAGYRSASDGGGNGVYSFDITVRNDGMAGIPVPDGNEQVLDPAPAGTITDFTAKTEASTEVTCVPDPLPAGTLTITSPAGTQFYSYLRSEMHTATVLVFKVRAGAECVRIDSLTIAGGGNGDEASIGAVGLFLDPDEDGLAATPNPYLPLASTTFGADNGVATFTAVDPLGNPVPLVIVPADVERQFLITYGGLDGPPLSTIPGAVLPAWPRLPPTPIWDWLLLTLLAALAMTRAMANRRLARPLAIGMCLSIAVLMTGVIGCGTSDTSPGAGGEIGSIGPFTPPTNPFGLGSYSVTLDPAALDVAGATTGRPIAPEGEATNAVAQVVQNP